MAEYLQAQWKKILGVDIKVDSTDTKTWMADLLATKHKMYIAPYNFDYVDASNFFDLFVTPGSRHNWVNKDYNALIAKADSTFDWKDRAPLYQKAEQIIVDQAAMLYLAHTTQYTCWKSNITGPGVQANKSGFYPLLTLYTWTHITKQ
jgi:oligopeptide transport system substrate-binding protein